MVSKSKRPVKFENANKKGAASITSELILSFSDNWSLKTVVYSGISIIILTLSFFIYLIVKITSQDSPLLQTNNVEISNANQETLPSYFPADFPVYSDSILVNHWTTKSTSVTGVSVVWESDESAAQIFNFYFTELVSQGYETEVVSQNGGTYTLSLNKANTDGFIGISSIDSKTQISVTLGIKNEQ